MSPSPAEELLLDIHGVGVRVRSDDAWTLGQLGKDFAYFRSASARPDIELILRLEPPSPEGPRGRFRWRSCRFGDLGGERRLEYPGPAGAVYDLREEKGTIRASEPHLLRELAYLTIHSRVGRLLDLRGLHRVHAWGFSFRGRGGLLLLPEAGGKTTLALESLRSGGELRLLSDDLPLVSRSGREMRAFPLRPGLRGGDSRGVPEERLTLLRRREHGEKRMVDLEHFRGKIDGAAFPAWVFAGSPPSARGPSIRPCSTWTAGRALLGGLLVGVGLPQVLELMLPPPPYGPELAVLARIGLSRARAAVSILRRADLFRFRLGPDPAENAAELERFLRESSQ